jgi:hypothetical protein
LEKQKQLKAKTMVERKRINCKIIETGAEIVSQFKGIFVSFLLKMCTISVILWTIGGVNREKL